MTCTINKSKQLFIFLVTYLLKFIIISYFFCISCIAFGQTNDAIKITEAKLAIEKYKDYKGAIKALEEISNAGKNDPLYLYYSAIANEKIGEYEKAVSFYQQYLNFFPDKVEIIEKIADLNYKLKLNKDLNGSWGTEYVSFEINQVGDSLFMSYKNDSPDKLWNKGDLKFKGIRNKNVISGKFRIIVQSEYPGLCNGLYDYEWVDCTAALTGRGTDSEGKNILFTCTTNVFYKYDRDESGDPKCFKTFSRTPISFIFSRQ